MTDLRDVGGRLRRLVLSALIGVVGSIAITLAIPTRDHFPVPEGGCGFGRGTGFFVEGGSLYLMIAGAVAIALAAYRVLGFVRSRAAPLPRAIVTSRAAPRGARAAA
jgi:hypothetical protein